jgi:benzylsuccinate CoA-transferase BbsF subunit
MTGLPLEGYRVVNFGWLWAAPLIGYHLADFGAEVIRVESNSNLGIFRRWALPLEGDQMDTDIGGAIFQYVNHSVLSITANLRKPEGIELCKKLVAISDVVIENFHPRVMKSLGLDYENLRQIKSNIIMVSLSGVGQTGPLCDVLTYGPSVAALSGLQSLYGYTDGEIVAEAATADPAAGTTAAFLVLAALRHRNRTGEGEFIDMGQTEPTSSILGEPIMDFFMNQRVAGFQGNRRAGMVPHNIYPCRGDDEWVSIAVETDEEWKSFCDAIGNPPWTTEERFADKLSRLHNQDKLDELISEWTVGHTGYDVTAILQSAGVAAMPCFGDEGVWHDPHHRARETFVLRDHPKVTRPIPYPGPVWKLSETPGEVRRAPILGEHNDYVYRELLHLTKEEIARLVEEEVIY